MVELGYSDNIFPAWRYSPANAEDKNAQPSSASSAESSTKLNQAQQSWAMLKLLAQAHGRRALIPIPQITLLLDNLGHVPSLSFIHLRPASLSFIHLRPASLNMSQLASASYSDEESSLLDEVGVTEITPGMWMRTSEQTARADRG
jgi:hypothetical protein